MELKKAQSSTHHTVAKLPISGDNGEIAFEEVEIWFHPLTIAMLEELEATNTASKQLSLVEAKAMSIVKQLKRWSVTDEGQPVEPTYDVLKTFDRLQLDALLEAITDYTFPKKTT